MLAGFLRQDLPLRGPRTLPQTPQLRSRKLASAEKAEGKLLRRAVARPCASGMRIILQWWFRRSTVQMVLTAPLTTACVITTGGWSTYQLAVLDDRRSLLQVWHPRQLFWFVIS